MLDLKEFKVHNDKSMYFKILEFLKKPSSPNFVELLMPEYISEPNKHIEEYLDYYCNDRLNDYAVLIRGDWGAGKTWFIKEYEKKLNQDGFNRVVYISLNGVSGKDAIDDMIFCALHPVLSHKITKVIGRVAAGVIKTSTKIDINDNEATLSLSIPTVDVGSVFKDGKKLILIFDDLERCQMKVSETLGYINYFVEHTESRAIILANEEKLKTCETYNNEKEKLVGATFKFEGDIRSALSHFIDELSNRYIKPKLRKNNNFESIITTYNCSKFNNIRSLKQSLREFERFYENGFLKDNEELFAEILILFLSFSLELRNNGFNGEVLKFPVENEKGKLKQFEMKNKLKEKYNLSRFGVFLLSDDTWNNILSKNIIDNAVIEDELESNYFRYLEEQPEWYKLWYYYDLKNSEFNQLLNQAINRLNESEYNELGEVIHVVAECIYFNEKKITSNDLEVIKKAAFDNIKKIHKEKDRWYVDPYRKLKMSPSWGGLSYLGCDLDTLDNFLNEMFGFIENLEKEAYSEDAKTLIDLMISDPYLFVERITLTNSKENYYARYPILKEISAVDFARSFCNLPLEKFRVAVYGLSERYSLPENILKNKALEGGWLNNVIDEVQKICDTKDGIEHFTLKETTLAELQKIHETHFKKS